MTFLTNLTLWKKITLLTILGLLLGFGVLYSLGMRAVNQATEAMLQDRLTTARLVASYIDETLGHALNELINTARMIEEQGINSDFEPQIESLEATYSRSSIYTHGIYILSEEGKVIWSNSETMRLDSSNIYSYPDIGQAMRTGKTTISGLISAPTIDTPVIFLTSPTMEMQVGTKCALVVAIDLARSNIGGFVQPIRLGETGYVEIVDQNGLVVTRTKPGPELAPFEESDHSGRFAELISAGEATRGVCHTCHESAQKVESKDVLAFVPLSKANWGVVVRQSEEEALAPTNELRLNLLLFGFGLFTIAILFVLVTTRDIGSRIRMLTVASRRIAEGDLVSPVTTSGKDEVGILAQTFDDMRTKLKTSYGELEHKTKELSSLLSVSEILTSNFDLPHLLDAVVAKAVEIIPGADGGVLLRQSADGSGLQVSSAVGLDKEPFSQSMLVHGKSSSGSIAKPADEDQEEKVNKIVASFLESDTFRSTVQSYIRAEIFHKSQHIGSLIIVSLKDMQAFSESDRRLLRAIADYVAIAIERAQLTKDAEEARALYEADRLRSEFISSVSHELRTPLTLIKGYSTSLLRQDTSWDKKTQREFLQIIDEKTEELRDLIDKLLQSAKLEAGALKLEKEPVLIPRLTQKIVDEILSRAGKRKITIEFTPSFPVVEVDVRCIEQVLRNLVENAVKYSPEISTIVIAGNVDDGKVMVSVSDNGTGISREHQNKVFERFYRVDSPSTRGIHGSGLGLSITKGHVEAHGGEVWLESTIGKGSKFFFSLPYDHIEQDTQE
jgi:signal transduction histidine kinase/HAMP domain-containing protein